MHWATARHGQRRGSLAGLCTVPPASTQKSTDEARSRGVRTLSFVPSSHVLVGLVKRYGPPTNANTATENTTIFKHHGAKAIFLSESVLIQNSFVLKRIVEKTTI